MEGNTTRLEKARQPWFSPQLAHWLDLAPGCGDDGEDGETLSRYGWTRWGGGREP